MTQLRFDALDPTQEQGPVRRARVLLAAPVGLLDYRVPEELGTELAPGAAVLAPLRNRRTKGYVVEVIDGPAPEGIRLKDLHGLDAERLPLAPGILELILFAADYYGAPAGEVLSTAVPGVPRRASRRYGITAAGRAVLAGHLDRDDRRLLELAHQHDKGFTVAAVERDLGWTRRAGASRLRRHSEKGWLAPITRRRGPRQAAAFIRLEADVDAALSARQKATRELLEAIPFDTPVLASALGARFKNIYAKLKTLEQLGLVARSTEAQRLRPAPEPTELGSGAEPPTPTAEQAVAIAALEAHLDTGAFGTFLLRGVTSSGKTEIYLRLIAHALAAGRTALVLVPEIALTPQLGARFRDRFGERVGTFHSGLTPAQRRDEWERIASGEAVIGLGARSALFLPLADLGVIIVDEEHDTSYKQEESPRHNARDLAVVRGRSADATVVLGSATPSIESRHNAELGRYQHLVLSGRVHDRPMPEVRCIDMVSAERIGDGIFSAELHDAVARTLAAGEQTILFLNRRGFAPYVFCRDCGIAFRCDDCDVALTLHRGRDRLLCHYCGYEQVIPDECPSCHGLRLEAHGLGTERVEAELRALLGGRLGEGAIVRLDRDTVRRRADVDRQLGRFRRGEAQILVGTQMVTKGHDFPDVTLVGVIAADVSLNFPDFRAAERTFQLLTQVAGRAGRGDKPGQVLVQTYETEHFAIRAAMAHDYEAFIAVELENRRELSYPPFAHLALLRFEGANEQATLDEADRVVRALRGVEIGPEVSVLGPAPAPLARLRGLWRFHILLKAERRSSLRQVLAAAPRGGRGDVRRILDVDPVSML